MANLRLTSRIRAQSAIAAGVMLAFSGIAHAVELGTGANDSGNDNNVAIGTAASTPGCGGSCIAIGNNAEAVAGGTAIGIFADALETDSTGVGSGAHATAVESTAIGTTTEASGALSTALGARAEATGPLSTATGANSRASGQQSSAFGQNARATRLRSTAVGHGAAATANDGSAFGKSADVAAGGGTALGRNAQVRSGADSSVALGQNSVANSAMVVSVGRSNERRRIIQVEDGINEFDAVNVGQLDAVVMANNMEQQEAINEALAAVKELRQMVADRDQMLATMQSEIDELNKIEPHMLANVAD